MPDFRLVSEFRPTGDQPQAEPLDLGDFNHFLTFMQEPVPKEEAEEIPNARLIWCLNAGGRRNYLVQSRPDQSDSSAPQPDFLLRDEVTGQEIALEVTRLFWPDEVNDRTLVRRKIARGLGCALSALQRRVVGSDLSAVYRVLVEDFRMGAVRWQDGVITMAKRIVALAPSLQEGQTASLDSPFRARVSRGSDLLQHAHFLVSCLEDLDWPRRGWGLTGEELESLESSETVQDHETDLPDFDQEFDRWVAQWRVPEDVLSFTRNFLSEAERKLSSYADVVRAALIDFQFELYDEDWLYADRLAHLRGDWPSIDRLYMHYRELGLGSPAMIRRIW